MLTLALVGAGVLQLGLAVINLLLPRWFRWRVEMRAVSLFTRQIFFVHLAFIVILVAGFGAVTIAAAPELQQPGILSRALDVFLTAFWAARLTAQVAAYSPQLWRGNGWKTTAHVAMTLLWIFLTAVYGLALLRAWGRG